MSVEELFENQHIFIISLGMLRNSLQNKQDTTVIKQPPQATRKKTHDILMIKREVMRVMSGNIFNSCRVLVKSFVSFADSVKVSAFLFL